MKKCIGCLCLFILIVETAAGIPVYAAAEFDKSFLHEVLYRKEQEQTSSDLVLECPSAVLMEPVSGTVLYAKDKDRPMPLASVTKIMTMLLIMEAIDKGSLHYKDTVSVSAHAASMGGSQVFLEEGETQSVDTMLKCIAVSSANDACVAMAEKVAGSEEAFVKMMNAKAKKLGMQHTHFVNCCGLDADGHESTAYDIALMSRELTQKHKDIFRYTKIWMDTFTHVTAKGEKEFGLSNTNKLIRQYKGATGLKTGSTSKAGFCLSATANRNHMKMIAVVMAAKDAKARVREAARLLDYGFANCTMYQDRKPPQKNRVKIQKGKKDVIRVERRAAYTYVCQKGENAKDITRKIVLEKRKTAPVKKGEKLGYIQYYLGKKKLGTVCLVAKEPVKQWTFADCAKRIFDRYLLQVS